MEKILCVDDDSSLLCLYQEVLSEEGYKVILAKDGKEALSKFVKEKPQLVVLDIRMPVMDGIETLNALLAKDRQAQVILNTAYPQYKENFMTWGAAAYVMKSSDLGELKQKIRNILKKRADLPRSGSREMPARQKDDRPLPSRLRRERLQLCLKGGRKKRNGQEDSYSRVWRESAERVV